jgi:hypothetical protein
MACIIETIPTAVFGKIEPLEALICELNITSPMRLNTYGHRYRGRFLIVQGTRTVLQTCHSGMFGARSFSIYQDEYTSSSRDMLPSGETNVRGIGCSDCSACNDSTLKTNGEQIAD